MHSPLEKKRVLARVRREWPHVRVDHVESSGAGDTPEVGAVLTLEAFVSLGQLGPDDVTGTGRQRISLTSIGNLVQACVLAATVVIHGLGCATVEAPGPLLPAEALTYTPAAAANRNETSTEFVNAVVVPEIE